MKRIVSAWEYSPRCAGHLWSGTPSDLFFTVPIRPGARIPWKKLLQEHPTLNHSDDQHLERDVFVSGYLCHLQADWIWIKDIFLPVFGPAQIWETFRKRLYLHNVLRAYLDEKVLETLPADAFECLQRTEPNKWLPFVQDEYLKRWCDYLSNQLSPGVGVKTIEVFALRQGLDPELFYSIIHSESQMEVQVFRQIPREKIEEYRRRVITMNLDLLQKYLSGRLRIDSRSGISSPRQPYSFERSE